MFSSIDREIVADLYLSRAGLDFLTELVEKFGARFGGTVQEQEAACFIRERLAAAGAEKTWLEQFTCPGWTRRETTLTVTHPRQTNIAAIALPFCPPGAVEGPLVWLGDGHPQAYQENRERLRGAVAMVTTATPRFYHRQMHRGEKIGRALEAGAIGFIWMRGEPGGLPETGAARLGFYCEVPAVSVSFEAGHQMLRLAREADVRLRITSTNQNHQVTSHNVIAELKGIAKPEEVIVVGAHYDGHDISQAAADNGAGTAVLLETLRALARQRKRLARTVRFVAFAQEEMGLFGSEHYASSYGGETVFMLNLDGAGRGSDTSLQLQGWPEKVSYFRDILNEMYEEDVAVGDSLHLYSDMYSFASRGIPAATLISQQPATKGAPRGYGHTPWDTLDKIQAKPIQIDAARIARMILRLAGPGAFPLKKKEPAEIGAKLKEMGYDAVLRYEGRPLPSE